MINRRSANFCAHRTILAAITASLLCAGATLAAELATKRQPDVTRLTFLVEYIGSDYRNAVNDGQIANQMEYGEMLRFSRQAVDEYAASGRSGDEIATKLAQLQKSIEAREDSRTISAASRDLLKLMTSRLENVPAPAQTPNVASGRDLFAANCAQCHGSTGAADGALAKGLTPPPRAFRGEWMDQLTPRHVFNTLTLGVDGTSMLSFSGTLSEPQRWDVAFYVMTLHDGFAPALPPAGVTSSLDELVATSNAELLQRLRSTTRAAPSAWVDYLRANPRDDASANDAAEPKALSAAIDMQDAFASVADRIFPFVVGVSGFAADPGQVAADGMPQGWQIVAGDDDVFPGYPRLHSGSGFLVGSDGTIATCAHLVRDADGKPLEHVSIALRDGKYQQAHVVGMEPSLDLAILRLDDSAWTPPRESLAFGDSDELRPGHWLIGLGDPAGPDVAFMVGVVASAPARQCYQEQRSATVVQSSLAIPASAIGGPVVDIHAKVVGIGVLLPAVGAAGSETAEKQEPAILPVNLLLNLTEALQASRSFDSPWLGISVLELDAARERLAGQAAAGGVPESGVYIDNVFEPSPATRAGVRRGDFLMEINGRPVSSVSAFQQLLYTTGIGHPAELRLLRAGQALTLTVQVEKRPGDAAMR